MAFVKASSTAPPVRDAGGDNEVPRDGNGRPKILVPCDNEACVEGRVPSEKKPPPATIQCPRCKGKVRREVAYTRTTTYIDCIEDKSNLEAWHKRMVLIGVATDPTYTDEVLAYVDQLHGNPEGSDEHKAAKDWLNRRAESAADTAGAKDKANKGTFLHGLSEMVDSGEELPDLISFHDVIDMDAYKRGTAGFKIERMEQLHVLDEFKVAGTPDRVSEWVGAEPLVAPNGYVFEPGAGELLITDLKTGTVKYGGLKMAMQLAIYAHSMPYDWRTGERMEPGPVNQEWGIIMHGEAGAGRMDLYWADLTLGWRAVGVAREIRALRSQGRAALTLLRAVA